MRCPKCCREVDDQDLFCGFCGAKIESWEKPVRKKSRKIGIKVFLLFSIIAMLSGTALGFCTARGIICWKKLAKKNEFQWTDFSEAVIEPDRSRNGESEKEEKSVSQKTYNKDTKFSEEESTQED